MVVWAVRALGPMLPPSPGERWPVSCPFQAAHTAPRQMSGIGTFSLCVAAQRSRLVSLAPVHSCLGRWGARAHAPGIPREVAAVFRAFSRLSSRRAARGPGDVTELPPGGWWLSPPPKPA